MKRYTAVMVLALGLGMQAAHAVSKGSQMQVQSAESARDAAFVKQAMLNNHAAVEESNLVLQKTSSEHVKQIAQTVIDTHTKMLQQLEKDASDAVSVPERADGVQTQRLSKLRALEGGALDRQLIRDMVQPHTSELHAYQAEAAHGQAEALRSLSHDEVPVIQQHLDDLRGLQQSGL